MNFKLEYKKLFGTWLAPSPAAGVTIDLAQHGDAVVFTAWVEVPGPSGQARDGAVICPLGVGARRSPTGLRSTAV